MSLNGKWYNELGSEMDLTVEQGLVTGTYHTAVGDAKGEYPLAGRADITNDTTPNIGFVVSWENQYANAESVTAWSGQYQIVNKDDDEEEVITTFWLLTMETNPKLNWRSTLVGQDTFKRTRPTDEQINAKLGIGPASHPLK
jgi:hypothetical protein